MTSGSKFGYAEREKQTETTQKKNSIGTRTTRQLLLAYIYSPILQLIVAKSPSLFQSIKDVVGKKWIGNWFCPVFQHIIQSISRWDPSGNEVIVEKYLGYVDKGFQSSREDIWEFEIVNARRNVINPFTNNLVSNRFQILSNTGNI